jgi:very-short-patch-repair endonuclease
MKKRGKHKRKHNHQPREWWKLTDAQKSAQLQKRALPTERALAPYLSERGILGWGVRWNGRVGNYFPDFTCEPLALIIEIDGASHEGREAADAQRQKSLEDLGYIVHRLPSRMPLDDKLAKIDGFVRVRLNGLGIVPSLPMIEERAKQAAHRDSLAD